MIADTTFVSDFLKEERAGQIGPAGRLMASHRNQKIRLTIISVGELLAWYVDSDSGWRALARWPFYRLHPGIVTAAANIDRALIAQGQRLGENDNWIAGFAAYYREPIISRDEGFDRVPGVRRIAYG